jgi:hypothetical protein
MWSLDAHLIRRRAAYAGAALNRLQVVCRSSGWEQPRGIDQVSRRLLHRGISRVPPEDVRGFEVQRGTSSDMRFGAVDLRLESGFTWPVCTKEGLLDTVAMPVSDLPAPHAHPTLIRARGGTMPSPAAIIIERNNRRPIWDVHACSPPPPEPEPPLFLCLLRRKWLKNEMILNYHAKVLYKKRSKVYTFAPTLQNVLTLPRSRPREGCKITPPKTEAVFLADRLDYWKQDEWREWRLVVAVVMTADDKSTKLTWMVVFGCFIILYFLMLEFEGSGNLDQCLPAPPDFLPDNNKFTFSFPLRPWLPLLISHANSPHLDDLWTFW